jgi:hypothetical protein
LIPLGCGSGCGYRWSDRAQRGRDRPLLLLAIRRESARPVVAVPGPEVDEVLVLASDQPKPIVLELVNPLRPRRDWSTRTGRQGAIKPTGLRRARARRPVQWSMGRGHMPQGKEGNQPPAVVAAEVSSWTPHQCESIPACLRPSFPCNRDHQQAVGALIERDRVVGIDSIALARPGAKHGIREG